MKKLHSVKVLVSLIFLCILASGGTFANEKNRLLFEVIQEGVKTGTCLAETSDAGNGAILREICHYPLDYFPQAVFRTCLFDNKTRCLVKMEEIKRTGSAREYTAYELKDNRACILFDSGRFAFFIENPGPAGAEAWPLSDDSPGLLYRFFQNRLHMLPAKKSEMVDYYLPSESPQIRRGEITSAQGRLSFKGLFNAEALVEYQQIKEISLPGRSVTYRIDPKGDTDSLMALNPEDPAKGAPLFLSKPDGFRRIPVSFKSGDGTALNGILTLPAGKPPHPAFLLLPGSGPWDFSGGGLLSDLSFHLARAGVATLSFDKRGAGSSKGSYLNARFEDFLIDADGALNYLSSVKEVDPLRMGVLGHSEGGLIALRLAMENRHVRGLILMATPSVGMFPEMAKEQGDKQYHWGRWSAEDLEQYEKSLQHIKKALDEGFLWLNHMNTRLCLSVIKSYYLWPDPMVTASKLKMPVLILHGRDDDTVSLKHSYNLNLSFNQGGNTKTTLIVFTDTDHFFGRITGAGESLPYRRRIILHPQVAKALLNWIRPVYYLNPPPEEEK